MSKNVKAVYENGVFRPLEPVALDEHQEVTVTIPDRGKSAAEETEQEPSCYELAQRAGIIGAIDNLPSDLSTNREYFEGLGKE